MTKVQLVRREGRVIHLEGVVEVSGRADGDLASEARWSQRTGLPVEIAGRRWVVAAIIPDVRPGLVLVGVRQ